MEEKNEEYEPMAPTASMETVAVVRQIKVCILCLCVYLCKQWFYCDLQGGLVRV